MSDHKHDHKQPVSLGEMAEKLGLPKGPVSMAQIAKQVGYGTTPIDMDKLSDAVDKKVDKKDKE